MAEPVNSANPANRAILTCALTGVHFSRMAEDLILWASQEFKFIELPDAGTVAIKSECVPVAVTRPPSSSATRSAIRSIKMLSLTACAPSPTATACCPPR